MKTLTEERLIKLFQKHYGNDAMLKRLLKLNEEVNELNDALIHNHTPEQIKSEITDVYSVIIDIAARYDMYLSDVVKMTVDKHRERGKE